MTDASSVAPTSGAETHGADLKNDFLSMTRDGLGHANLKLALVMFLVGLVLFSDLFAARMLSGVRGAVDRDTHSVTTKGTVVTLMLYSFALVVVDLLIKAEAF